MNGAESLARTLVAGGVNVCFTCRGAVQPMSRPFTVSLTSMLPRVALEYGHT